MSDPMTPSERLHVVRTADGWALKPEGQQAIARGATQRDVDQVGRAFLSSIPGGGEIITHRPNGKIRSSDTINRPDPAPPIDREH